MRSILAALLAILQLFAMLFSSGAWNVPPQEDTSHVAAKPTVEEQANTLLQTMTLREKVCQLFITTPDDLIGQKNVTTAGEKTEKALREYPVGGLIYFSRNLKSASQITQMTDQTALSLRIRPFLCVDEEGGRVSRLSGIGVTDTFRPMAYYGKNGDAQTVFGIGETLGKQIRRVGLNVDFAPVADIVTNPKNTEIGDRSFSSDPAVAAEMVQAMVRGLQSQNMISCLKHFPGHGSTEADSHNGKTVSDRTVEQLRESELIPFRAGIDAGVDMVMLSHMSLPNVVGDDTPCDLSKRVVTGLLREELGFTGVIVTDSHSMGAITKQYSCAEATVLALQAGCDVILLPANLSQAVTAVLQAVQDGTLSESRINESVKRILILKYKRGIL